MGTDAQRITEPIYAVSELTINGGTLYMEPIVPQADVSMIGTGSTRTISINGDAKISVKYIGNYRSERPFYSNGEPVKVIIADTTIGIVAEDTDYHACAAYGPL